MAVYSIKELEKLSGIKAHTIRMWEKRYNLIDPHRTQTNIRYYTDYDLKKILNVAVLNRHGIKISDIARLNEAELKEEMIRVSNISHSHENLVDSLIVSMIELDDYKMTALLEKSISKIGLKETVFEVLYPFLEKVGIFWQTGDVNPVQEHFVSCLIRQKIIAAIDRVPNTFNPKAKIFLLLLPEGEWHEIGLLFAQYLLRESGHEVIYLGQSVPYSDVLATGATREFDSILVSCTTNQPEFNFVTFLKDLGGAFPDKRILFFSSFIHQKPDELGPNHILISTSREFAEYLSDLSE
ncbi:MAG: MerR family transcriptional regulator [Bacteroidota bacterium]